MVSFLNSVGLSDQKDLSGHVAIDLVGPKQAFDHKKLWLKDKKADRQK